MGALKGRFQCLRGLRVQINTKEDHVAACRWVTIAIILHNLVIDVEGPKEAMNFRESHGRVEEEMDRGRAHAGEAQVDSDGERKRRKLINELLEYRRLRHSI